MKPETKPHIPRAIDSALEEWAGDDDRKPLLLRGARQTGKTAAVRHLSRLFGSFVELNFEEDPGFGAVFDGAFDIARICAEIEALSGAAVSDGDTLLFLDEIQACPRAISALRYFREKRPGLHVVATGSLLEFAFADMSDFGVGRVRNMFVHPLSFREFLGALGDARAMDAALAASPDSPVPGPVHDKLLSRLKEYFIVGGMPAAVSAFAEKRSYVAVRREQDDILVALKSDFGKYKERVPPSRIRDVLASIVRQTGEKFTYTDSLAGLTYRQAKECAELLEQARLAVRVDACHANGVPLGGDVDVKGNKFAFFDTGLYMRECGIDLSEWMLDAPAKFVNRGKLAELFAGLELLSAGSPLSENRLFHWHREAKSSNAEVDYVIQAGSAIVPVEVKAGKTGSMKSLRLMMAEKGLPLGIRLSSENFGRVGPVVVVPLYLAGECAAIACAAKR